MKYTIDEDIFDMFPNFRRAVVVATGVRNQSPCPETAALLAAAAAKCSNLPEAVLSRRLEIWDDAFRKFQVDPQRYTPSVRFLNQQIARGKSPRPISALVDLFNATSITWAAPCGGDDLNSLDGGDLRLGFATGKETFAPLFKPNAIEHAERGEVIYFCPQTNRVLCRRWTWRNSDFSKITDSTKNVAINIDMMLPPFADVDLTDASDELLRRAQQYCGGNITTYILSPTATQFDFKL